MENILEAEHLIKSFAAALHKMREFGIDIQMIEENNVRKLEIVEMETDKHLGEYAFGDLIYAITGQVIDELVLDELIFPDYKGREGFTND